MIGDLTSATGDVYCDRRFVSGDKEPSPFCQEVIDTIAVSQISDDCRNRHAARTDTGRCPRDRIIAGCKLEKDNEDGSEVWDWYYDVSDLELDGGSHFENPVRTKDQVMKMCADRKRYEDGATFTDRP